MVERLLRATAKWFGSPKNFALWLVITATWASTGPLFHFSNTWQLLVNTPTTLLELFAAIAIQHVTNEVERKQDQQQETELELTQHIEDMAERIEATNEAQLLWLERIHHAWLVHTQSCPASTSAPAQDPASGG